MTNDILRNTLTAFSSCNTIDSKAQNTSEAFTLLAGRSLPVWWPAVRERIESFRRLGSNWDSYGAEEPNAASIAIALELLQELGTVVGVKCPEIGVTPTGNVALSWELNEATRSLDIEVLESAQFKFGYFDENDDVIEQGQTNDLLGIANALTQW